MRVACACVEHSTVRLLHWSWAGAGQGLQLACLHRVQVNAIRVTRGLTLPTRTTVPLIEMYLPM